MNKEDSIKLKDGINIRNLLTGVDFTVEGPRDNVDDEDLDLILEFENHSVDNNLGDLQCDLSQQGLCDIVKEKMVPISEDGKLKKYVVREGNGPSASEGVTVFLHYNAFVENKKIPFDSTYVRGHRPERVKLGVGAVYEGFELAVRSMKKGEMALFLIHPDLAFGAMGAPPRIPRSATIFIEIELIVVRVKEEGGEEIVDESSCLDYRSFQQVYRKTKVQLLQGNNNFANNSVNSAINNYRSAEKILNSCRLQSDEEEKKWKKLLMKVYLNLCICYNHPIIKKPRIVCLIAQDAFDLFPELACHNSKLYFQMGKAKFTLNSYKDAEKYFLKAMKCGEDVEVIEHLDKLRRTMHIENELDKIEEEVGFHAALEFVE